MIFDGTDFGRWMRTSPVRKLVAPREVATVRPGAGDGERVVRTRFLPLVIPVRARLALPCTWKPGQVARARREIAAALVTDGPRRLEIDGEDGLYYMAVLTAAGDLTTLRHNGACDLEFTAFDPIAYGKEREAAVGGAAQVEVGGTHGTHPVFSLVADGTGRVLVRNHTSGAYVETAAAVQAGANVTIDMGEQTVRVNSNLAAVQAASDFFALEPGANDVRVARASGTVSWTERWV